MDEAGKFAWQVSFFARTPSTQQLCEMYGAPCHDATPRCMCVGGCISQDRLVGESMALSNFQSRLVEPRSDLPTSSCSSSGPRSRWISGCPPNPWACGQLKDQTGIKTLASDRLPRSAHLAVCFSGDGASELTQEKGQHEQNLCGRASTARRVDWPRATAMCRSRQSTVLRLGCT